MDLPTIVKEYMSFFFRNLFLVGMLFVLIIVSFIGVILIDGWVGLHTFVFVGDVDLALVAFMSSLLISVVVTKKSPMPVMRLSDIVSDLTGVVMCMAAALIYGIVEGSFFSEGLFSAYLLSFLAVSMLFTITYVAVGFLFLKGRL